MKKYRDLIAQDRSAIIEQLKDRRKKMGERLASVRHILAVGSGKGGVGKSTLVMQLACVLQSLGRKTAILDADFNGPSQACLGGVIEKMPMPGHAGLIPPRMENGIAVLSFGSLFPENQSLEFETVAEGESHTWRATREFTLLEELLGSITWGDVDYLLIDLPPGPHVTFQFAQFFGQRANLLLVAIPSALARSVVQRSVEALKPLPNRILGYVENMSGYFCHGCSTVQPLFPRSHAVSLSIPCLAQVPFDCELAKLCDAGKPITESHSVSTYRVVKGLAEIICHELEGGSYEVSVR